MLDVLLSPQILGLLFLALVIIGVIVVVIRRRRGQAADVAPPVDIGEPVDYTSIPYEEPTSLGDRFRNASPIVKALVILVPLLVIGGLIALAMTLTPSDGGTAIIPPPPPPEIAVTRAEVAGNGKILIVGTTNLPNDGSIKASLLENREPFAWFNPETATTKPDNGKFTLTLDRADGAPVPQQ
ncbi:MAG TPA: SH3 domain-containing protein, partial [Roseiflexaceae bacterium]|nr:SH3 domain-containing protein [Roseiflexaceae bacterium]